MKILKFLDVHGNIDKFDVTGRVIETAICWCVDRK